MSYGESVYDKPEAYGLKMVAEVAPNMGWEFDILAFWQDKRTGELYAASDSGCSCPCPFEDYMSRDSLEGPITKNRAYELLQEFADRFAGYGDYYKEEKSGVPAEVAEASAKIAELKP